MHPSRNTPWKAASGITTATDTEPEPTSTTVRLRRPSLCLSSRRAGVRGVVFVALSSGALACGGRQQPAPPAPEPVQAPPPAPAPATPSRVSVRAAASIADSIFVLTNRERQRADLTPLRRSAELARAAQLQAEQMATAQKLAHDLPGSRYPTVASRLKLVGYSASASAENIAEGYTSGAALIAGWMTSTPHRANILSARYTETGVGTARSRTGRTDHVQLFARRRG